MSYRTGTITLNNGSPTVTGAGTSWVDVGILNPGDILYAPDGRLYEVQTIGSNTGITLTDNYLGANVSGAAYKIFPIGLLPSALAQQVKAALVAANAAVASAVRADTNAQNLNATQQQNARTNIGALGAADVGSGGQSINVAGNANVTLSAAQAAAHRITLTGVLTGNIIVYTNNTVRGYVVDNQTMGAYTITFAVTAASGVVVPQGKVTAVECDGTNIVPAKTAMDGCDIGQVTPGKVTATTLTTTGSVGIGSDSLTGYSQRIAKNATGATTAYGTSLESAIQSDVTGAFYGFFSAPSTQAASFTVGAVRHFEAYQNAIGAGSSVTNQYGFIANSNLIGATNNYGFFGNIAAGTGRYNFYAAGTAQNYFAGNSAFGSALPASTIGLYNSFSFSSTSTAEYGFYSQAGATNTSGGPSKFGAQCIGYTSTGYAGTGNIIGAAGVSQHQVAGTSATHIGLYARVDNSAAGTVTTANGVVVSTATNTGGGTIANNIGVNVYPQTAGTNNWAFRGQIAAAANAFNVYMDGTADNYFGGNVGIGSTALTQFNFRLSRNITGAVSAQAIRLDGQIQSDVTTESTMILSRPSIAAAAFTIGDLEHFYASQGTLGAGAAITRQYGFYAESSLSGATNNYGFYSNLSAGTGRWNFYAAGAARNYFAGGLEVVAGTTGMTAGFTHVPSAAGAPTGAPTNPTGNVPLYYDATNNKLYVYNGAWKGVTLA